jgi:hypothetical protein
MRCFAFGLIGLVPVLGIGLAVQALRLQQRIAFEMKDSWKAPPVYVYWLLGIALLWAVDTHFGSIGDLTMALLVLAAQSFHIWRSFGLSPHRVWNPGRPQLTWGVICAYAGVSLSFWLGAVLLCRVTRLIDHV